MIPKSLLYYRDKEIGRATTRMPLMLTRGGGGNMRGRREKGRRERYRRRRPWEDKHGRRRGKG